MDALGCAQRRGERLGDAHGVFAVRLQRPHSAGVWEFRRLLQRSALCSRNRLCVLFPSCRIRYLVCVFHGRAVLHGGALCFRVRVPPRQHVAHGLRFCVGIVAWLALRERPPLAIKERPCERPRNGKRLYNAH